jgi:two-component system NtrC family response regulator
MIIDDDQQVCKTLVQVFTRMGHAVSYQQTLKKGLAAVLSEGVDVVFLDVNLPDGNGLAAIPTIKQYPASPEVIIITGDEDVDGAELAMRSKAWDYIPKTGSYKKFKFALERALEYRRQKQSVPSGQSIKREAIIGDGPLISNCLDKVAKAAGNDLPVVITGETGTGKELFSRAIHANSKRSLAGFVVVDCAALPEHLVESTLFGHVKGAFTGAGADKTGLMKMADKGTLFLDEVGELPLGIQKKFLRALQEKKFRPIGAKNEIASDFRLICATHRDLKTMVEDNKFRQDLFFRIFSINIHLPPLKDRKDDIKALVENQLGRKAGTSEENSSTMSGEFLEEIQQYEWSGNVRELLNTIDMVCSEAGSGALLVPHHLPGHIRAFNIKNKLKASTDGDTRENSPSPAGQFPANSMKFKAYIDQMKYEYIRQLLACAKGNIPRACTLSGLSRSQLYRLMQQFDLK